MAEPDKASVARSPAEDLLEILQLERLDSDLFLGNNEAQRPARLFGGQVLSQSLRAAISTVSPERKPHSLHGYFLRPGDPSRRVLYEVDRIRDGRSFTTRRVVAIQDGHAILNMSVSLQVIESGMAHEKAMPNVPPPEELEDDLVRAQREDASNPRMGPMSRIERAFELRSVIEPWADGDRFFSPVWMRFRGAANPDDQALQYSLLTYASDIGLVSTAALPHTQQIPRTELMLASLDHALWIHRAPVLDDWVLFAKRSSTATGARGLCHAEIYSRRGELLASVTQEGLLRRRRK